MTARLTARHPPSGRASVPDTVGNNMSFSPNPYVDSLVKEIIEAVKELPPDIFQNDNARKRVQRAAYQLTGAMDAPVDAVRRIIFQVCLERVLIQYLKV